MISGHLPVSGGHSIYYEKHGTACKPSLILHGGPGGGLQRHTLSLYDLNKCCVILFDQRGCGKSTPFGSIEKNTTWDLVEDIEALRRHLGFESWFVSGGSWGTTLALAYAQAHPSRVTGLLLRGLCFCDDASFRWLYEKGGASEIFPDRWASFVSVLPERLRTAGWKDIARFYHKKLNGPSPQKYVKAWWGWEFAVSRLIPDKHDTTPEKGALALARLENHYFVNDCWFTKDQLLRGLDALHHIPITIVHGRYDLVCPISASFTVKKVLPHTKLIVIPDAGHASIEPGIKRMLKREVARMHTQRKTLRKRKQSNTLRKRSTIRKHRVKNV
jgi:proline iminopeptidase